MHMAELKLISFNVRGLRQRAKRRAIFHFLHTVYPRHIAVLQETHSMPADAKIWKAEWGGDIMFSHSPSSNESGVAVLLPKSLYACCSVLSAECDDRDRLVVSLQIETSRLKLFGVYAPTQSHNRVQIEFYENLREKLEALSIELNFLVLCGDFNIHLGKLDVASPRFRLTRAAKILSSILKDLRLVDVWRELHPDTVQYTWRRLEPVQQSRIDYMIVSRHLVENHMVTGVDIQSGVLSDHSVVTLAAKLVLSRKGPGLWRFNNMLLEDSEFVSEVTKEINQACREQGKYESICDLGLRLEVLSGQARSIAVRRSKVMAKARQGRIAQDV